VNILAYQLSAPLARGPYVDLAQWLRQLPKCPFTGQVERALWAGFHADRLGYAFVGGYGAALSRLVEHVGQAQGIAGRPLPANVCLCATESGGAHPRAIATRLEKLGGALVLDGEKTFATLATVADELLVVASRGLEADGKNRLRVVRVSPKAKGVEIIPRPETPFTPEIPHAIVRFKGVVVEDEDMLPGDGYEQWLKPFRTIEDTHVLAATVGYLQGVARAYDFGHDVSAELISLALSLVDVGARDAGKPLTHIVLAGLFGTARRLVASLDAAWAKAPEDERARWERDRPLLMIADNARGKRTDKAWELLSA
jgi:hypothetical protein